MTTAAAAAAQPAPPPAAPLPGSPLYGGKTLVPAVVACTDLPTATVPTPPLRVLSPHTADLRLGAIRNEIVVLNAGAALYVADVAPSIAEGIKLARKAIRSGAARAKLDEFLAVTRALGDKPA